MSLGERNRKIRKGGKAREEFRVEEPKILV
jgi:hypothetical protein